MSRYDLQPKTLLKALKKSFALGEGVPAYHRCVRGIKKLVKVGVVLGAAVGAKILFSHK